jgi:hypothetical protein
VGKKKKQKTEKGREEQRGEERRERRATAEGSYRAIYFDIPRRKNKLHLLVQVSVRVRMRGRNPAAVYVLPTMQCE